MSLAKLGENGIWRDIDSAPKDGTEVVLSDDGFSYTGYWESRENYWGQTGWQQETARGQDWYSSNPWHPQKWQPLQEPAND